MSNASVARGVLVLRLEVNSKRENEFNLRYHENLARGLVRNPNVLSVRRFQAIDGQPNTWVLAEVRDIDAYRGNGRRGGPRHKRTMIELPGFRKGAVAQGLYRQIYPQYSATGRHGFNFANWSYAPPAGAQALMAVGFDVDARHENELHPWYEQEHIPLVLSVPGFLTARRFRLESGTENEPRYLALYDIATPYTFYSEAFARVRHSPWLERIYSISQRRFRCLYRLVP